MHLFLVQHGEARPKAEDPERPLTGAGAAVVRRTAEWAARAKIEVGEIRHSGKLRAQQTAEILAEHLHPASGVRVVAGMDPGDDVKPLARELRRQEDAVLLVGHLPFLSRLAGRLLTGDEEQGIIRFQYAGIVCLTRVDKAWSITWMVTPEVVG